MRKISILILCLVVIFIAGCTSAPQTTATQPEITPEEVATEAVVENPQNQEKLAELEALEEWVKQNYHSEGSWGWIQTDDYYAGEPKEKSEVTKLKTDYPELWEILTTEGLDAFTTAVEAEKKKLE